METPDLTSASFSSEQKEYLRGFFAGVADRGMRPFVGQTATGLLTNDLAASQSNLAEPEEEKYFGTPVSDLCREELWKYEENPLDIWDKLLAHADENRAPAPDDLFRFKFHGLFYVAPAQDSFMLRMRIPGGILTAYQLPGLAAMATDWGCGRVDITTRANLQIREFQRKDIVRVLNKLQSLGLSARGSGADNIRNITASPITGLDPTETVKESVAVKKALAVILYSLGKASSGMLGKLFGHSRALTYRWIAAEAAKLPEPVVGNDIQEMEFDEMWHFIGSKKTSYGSSRPWIVAHGELLPGLQAVVMLQHSGASTTKSSA